jgi:hypothetical protein
MLVLTVGLHRFILPILFQGPRAVTIEPEQSNFELLVANSKGLPVECVREAVAFCCASPLTGF